MIMSNDYYGVYWLIMSNDNSGGLIIKGGLIMSNDD